MLAAEFLASDEAEDLSDRSSASHCADRIIDYGCDQDFGRPLRMSPVKVETFLLNWLPRKVMLSAAEQEAMPHVLLAWVRWAGRRRGQDEKEGTDTLDAVINAVSTFGRATSTESRPTATRPSSAWTRSWWPGCCPTATWRRCRGGRSRSRCCTGGSTASTCRVWTRPTRTAVARC